MSNKTPLLDRVHAGTVAIAAVAIVLGAAALCWWQLAHYEDNLIGIFAEQQDQYVELAVDQIKTGKKDDKEIVDNVLESIAGSNTQYWTLTKDGDFLFVKDVTDSNRYRGLPSKTYYDSQQAQDFVAGLTRGEVQHAVIRIGDKDYIASGTEFKHAKATYRICLLTGKTVVIDHNAYLSARVNLATTIGVILALFVVGAIVMALHNDNKTKRLKESEADTARLREDVERLGDQLMGRGASALLPNNSKEATSMPAHTTRIYRFKFYLNASHYVFFDGKQGETHPHTWEFALKIRVDGKSLTQFSDYEKAIEVVFEPYQNTTINEKEPFDLLLPTLENLVESFGMRLREVVAGLDGELLELEGSETPTRSYMVSYE